MKHTESKDLTSNGFQNDHVEHRSVAGVITLSNMSLRRARENKEFVQDGGGSASVKILKSFAQRRKNMTVNEGGVERKKAIKKCWE